MLKKLIGPSLESKVGWLSGFAASLAFFYLLSLIPLLVVTITLLHQLIPYDLTPEVIRLGKNLLPLESKVSAESLVQSAKTMSQGGVLTINTLLALFTSYSFMSELIRALHFLFSESSSPKTSTWTLKFKSILLLFIWMITILLSSVLFLMTPLLQGVFQEWRLISTLALFVWNFFQYAFLLVILYAALSLTYRLSSRHKISQKLLRQGTAIAAVGWMLVSYGFTYFVPVIWNKSILHGAWGSILATLFWAYACAWCLLLGACWIKRGEITHAAPSSPPANP